MISMAGSVESCDCLITLFDDKSNCIDLRSDMIKQYGQQIKVLILELLETYEIKNVRVVIEDKGALDYTIKARMITALKRGGLL